MLCGGSGGCRADVRMHLNSYDGRRALGRGAGNRRVVPRLSSGWGVQARPARARRRRTATAGHTGARSPRARPRRPRLTKCASIARALGRILSNPCPAPGFWPAVRHLRKAALWEHTHFPSVALSALREGPDVLCGSCVSRLAHLRRPDREHF